MADIEQMYLASTPEEKVRVLNKVEDEILSLPGMTPSHQVKVLIEEGTHGKVFLKMMSDGGLVDISNCDALKQHLTNENITFTSSSDRSLTMSLFDLLAEFAS